MPDGQFVLFDFVNFHTYFIFNFSSSFIRFILLCHFVTLRERYLFFPPSGFFVAHNFVHFFSSTSICVFQLLYLELTSWHFISRHHETNFVFISFRDFVACFLISICFRFVFYSDSLSACDCVLSISFHSTDEEYTEKIHRSKKNRSKTLKKRRPIYGRRTKKKTSSHRLRGPFILLHLFSRVKTHFDSNVTMSLFSSASLSIPLLLAEMASFSSKSFSSQNKLQ